MSIIDVLVIGAFASGMWIGRLIWGPCLECRRSDGLHDEDCGTGWGIR